MERFAVKVLQELQRRDEPQARAARAIDVDPSQFSKWLKGRGVPTVAQLLALARHLGVPMEYLADDTTAVANGHPARPELTVDQRTILQVVEDLGLTRKEAIRRLAGPPVIDEDWRPEGKARLVSGGPGSNGGPG